MAVVWGGPDVATLSAQPSAMSPSPTPAFPGFDQFLLERFHPICWNVLQDTEFQPATDAQAKQVLNEIAGLEQTIYTKTGGMFIDHLQRNFFPSLNIDGTEFVHYMTTSTERRAFASYIQNFLKRRA